MRNYITRLQHFMQNEPYARTRRKVSRMLREVVPHNQQYRPTGVCPSSRELAAQPSSGVAYYGLVPAHTSTLVVPDDFYEHTSQFIGLHTKPNRQEEVPEAFVVTLDHGRLYADNFTSIAIITKGNKLVGDASFQFANRDLCRPEDNNIFRQRYFLEPQEVDGTVFSLLSGGGAGEGNFFHWLIDSLPRLHLIREAGLLDQIDYFLVYDKTRRFMLDTLAPLGIGPEKLLDLSTHRHLRARRLVVTSTVRGRLTHTPSWALQFLRDTMLPAATPRESFSPYIFVSRRDARFRHILNEPEVEAMLLEYGFQTHVLTPYSQAEKVALFAQAKVVVTTVGAGLTNLIFCQPDAQIIELLPKSFVVPEYQMLAARLGISYRHLVCESTRDSTVYSDAVNDHLTVDLAALRQLLEQVLEPESVR